MEQERKPRKKGKKREEGEGGEGGRKPPGGGRNAEAPAELGVAFRGGRGGAGGKPASVRLDDEAATEGAEE